jgi:hypothetical protein
MPVEFLAQNMSNRLDWIHHPEESPAQGPKKSSFWKRLIQVPGVKRLLLGVHDRIFRWYYE